MHIDLVLRGDSEELSEIEFRQDDQSDAGVDLRV